MKVVINDCFGGFGLSDAAMHRYAELKGVTLYPEVDEKFGYTTFWTVPENERTGILSTEQFHAASMEDRKASNERHSSMRIYDRDIPRDDPDLVRVVEELEGAASGRFAELKVVEIPDGISWEIDDYDGSESIEETHRSWR